MRHTRARPHRGPLTPNGYVETEASPTRLAPRSGPRCAPLTRAANALKKLRHRPPCHQGLPHGYLTIQGERWRFCCRRPMVYAGAWSAEEFSRQSPDGDGKKFFEKIVENCGPDLWAFQLRGIPGVYVFR